jgi:hypothetical protein
MKRLRIPRPKNPIARIVLVLLAILIASSGYWYAFQTLGYLNHVASIAAATKALPQYGIAAGGDLPSLSQSDLDARMAGIQALGVGWVRFDFDWSLIQPDNQSSYDWSAYDRIVASARSHNLKVIGIIDFTPGWAASSSCAGTKQCEPASATTYANFAAALSKRYAPQGLHYWEIWNEPNTSQFWQPAPNETLYISILKAAYTAIHNQDKNAIVLTGATAPASTSAANISPVDFLKGLYKGGAKMYFDAVADHPYTYPVPPSYKSDNAWVQMSAASNSLRSVMVANDDAGKKIWITEFGAPTGGPGPSADIGNYDLSAGPWHVTEALQAYSITEAIRLYKTYSWAGPLLIYSYQDAGTTQDTNENFFGLVRADGSHKPAYDAFVQAISAGKN